MKSGRRTLTLRRRRHRTREISVHMAIGARKAARLDPIEALRYQ